MNPPDGERCDRLMKAMVLLAKREGYSVVELTCAVAALRDSLASGAIGPEPVIALELWDGARRAAGPS